MLPTTTLTGIFVFSFVMAIGAVLSPGPISTAIVSQAPRGGWKVGPLVATGHSFLELLIVLLIVLGLGKALALPPIQMLIAVIGGVLLVWMGFSLIWNTWKGRLALPTAVQDAAPLRPNQLLGLGMAATASNPFWYAWWVTVAASYLNQAMSVSPAAVSAFYLGHISADYLWDTFLSSVLGLGRRWISQPIYQGMMLLCGVFFLYLGWVFLSQGIRMS